MHEKIAFFLPMAGLYVHIPFCKTRCSYCNFFSTTELDKMGRYVANLGRELELRKDFLPQKNLATLYWGGGTPSLLSFQHAKTIMDHIKSHFSFEPLPEITLEANPDDITEERLTQWRELGFNRLSIGIQSFDDNLLKLVNRRHTAQQAINAVKNAQQTGFHNISIDLIYGLPGQTLDDWKMEIQRALQLNVQHISAYGLSYEEGTPLYIRCQNKEIMPSDDELYNQMYDLLCSELQRAGFERYEVSNFARPNCRARHNSSYWHDVSYMGIGPGAHSYNGQVRQWNVENLQLYMDSLEKGHLPLEEETIDRTTHFNETLMLALRTAEGLDLSRLARTFGQEEADECQRKAQPYMAKGLLCLQENCLVPTQQGFHWLNAMITDLMKDV